MQYKLLTVSELIPTNSGLGTIKNQFTTPKNAIIKPGNMKDHPQFVLTYAPTKQKLKYCLGL